MTSRNKSTFASKHNTQFSSHREDPSAREGFGVTDTNRNQFSGPASNMLNSNNTHFSMEHIQSNGDNFIEICEDLNREIKENNEKALKDYLQRKSSEITQEFVSKIRAWDQKRLDELRDKTQTEATNESDSEQELVSERVILENFKPEFKELIKMLLSQCQTYIDLVDMSKTIPTELKSRLKRIYNIMKKEAETVRIKKNFKIKDNSFFLEFIKGRVNPSVSERVPTHLRTDQAAGAGLLPGHVRQQERPQKNQPAHI